MEVEGGREQEPGGARAGNEVEAGGKADAGDEHTLAADGYKASILFNFIGSILVWATHIFHS